MSAASGRPPAAPLLRSVLGTTLVVVAVLELILIGGIGFTAWERATWSERWVRVQQRGAVPAQGSAGEAQELRALIAASRQATSAVQATLVTDADLARFLLVVRAQAIGLGIEITELSPQPTGPTMVPMRRFVLRGDGDWSQTVRLLAAVVGTLPAGACLDELALAREEGRSRISFELLALVRPASPPTSIGGPRPQLVALAQGTRHQE